MILGICLILYWLASIVAGYYMFDIDQQSKITLMDLIILALLCPPAGFVLIPAALILHSENIVIYKRK